jgi:hypothetical protein
MTREGDDFWDALGDHALDPIQVPMLEALWRIGELLSAIELVDVLDGYLSMWEAADHLEALHALGMVERTSADQPGKQESDFDVPYRLKTAARNPLTTHRGKTHDQT